MAPSPALLLILLKLFVALAAPDKRGKTPRTLALIKPDAYEQGPSILVDMVDLGFSIVEVTELHLSSLTAGQFYEEHRQRPFFDELVQFMSSGKILAAVLQKRDAVNSWRNVIGPTDSNVARETAPDTLRAKYGTDKTRNALHGSDSEGSAIREIGFFFPHLKTKTGGIKLDEDMDDLIEEDVGPGEEGTEAEDADAEASVDSQSIDEQHEGEALGSEAAWKELTQQEVIETITKLAREKGESIDDVVRRLNEMKRDSSRGHTEL
uniref:Nucleoside diphosphate kinase n=1 Tax=Tetraselmis chuii TaxID=63592 RepID=A0A6U1L4G9_9CHLO|mmetsp:Transcript_8361/g.15105  ORF Transcript_8361/g.15105 Transcript_8361/m.15105 type:complete len:265 (+) Transcript_8361:359-1153(+)